MIYDILVCEMVAVIKAGNVLTSSSFTRDRKNGSDCTGQDGATNRVLALSATPNFIISVEVQGRVLHNTNEYTLSGANLTFLGNIDNSDVIEVIFI